MSKGIYIIGTDTEVGKTVGSAGLMHLLLAGKHQSAYFKPVPQRRGCYKRRYRSNRCSVC